MATLQQQFAAAVRLLNDGRPEEALQHVQRLLPAHPEHAQLLHLAGVLRMETGDAEAGEALLVRAAELAPANPEIAYNHGSALLRLGRFEAAIERLDACLAAAPGHAPAWNNRGNALQALGRREAAAQSFERALAADPNHVSALVNLGQLHLEGGDAAGAEPWFRRALAIRPRYATAATGLAQALLDRGRFPEARVLLEQVAREQPGNGEAWRWLGRVLSELGDFHAAREACQRAVDCAPGSADAWNNLGSAWTSLGELAPAEEALSRALELEPGHREATVNLAALMELANRPQEALRLAARAGGEDPRLRLVRGKCLAREGQGEEGEDLLRGLLDEADPSLRREAWFALGALLDHAGRAGEAFEAFVEGNRLALEGWQGAHREPDRFVPGLAEIERVVTEWSGWREAVAGDEAPAPAFLFGFQRSGTTLLDTVLGAHPQVHVMEELPAINRVIARMDERYGPYPQALPELDEAALADLREAYWQQCHDLAGFDVHHGRLLLDKSPLHTVHLGLLRLLFPAAPMILALRHPLDVVLSCFMQDFTMNAFMTHFTSLRGAAQVYDAVMRLWWCYRDGVADQCHEIRYEELVADPEGHLRAVVEHLALPWDPAVLDHGRAARARGLINTPSYEQVTRPIYRTARGRWQRYRDPLAPVVPLLAPWLDRFAYEA